MLQVALQVAKYAPVAVKYGKAAAPYAKAIAIGTAVGVGINETQRLAVRLNNRRAERLFAEAQAAKVDTTNVVKLEVDTTSPLWRKLTGTLADESLGDSVARKASVFWDIATWAAGDTVWFLDFCTFKLVKLVFATIGGVATVVSYVIGAAAIGLFGAIFRRKNISKSIDWWGDFSNMLFLAPFRGVRWVDRKIDAFAHRLMAARSADKMDIKWYDRETDQIKTWNLGRDGALFGTKAAEPVETKVEEPVASVFVNEPISTNVVDLTDAKLKKSQNGSQEIKVEDQEPVTIKVESDIQVAIELIKAEKVLAEKDPQAYGESLFAKQLSEMGFDGVEAYRKNLAREMREMLRLSTKNVTLVCRGYDEAAKAASDTVTTS